MYNNKSSLQNTAGFTAFVSSNCWSSTAGSSGNHWRVYFNNGYSYTTNDTTTTYVRCVRDK
ncbi:MAG: DUF1566 domain-containing protein [Parabacteroides gordonii]|nr:DUF1566 domain-containing protein [Parabacteroides gordonii]